MGRPIAVVRGGPGSGKSAAVEDYLTRSATPFARFALPEDVVSIFDFVAGFADVLAPYTRGIHLLSAIASELVETNRNPALALVAWLGEQVALDGMTIVIDNIIDARQIAPIAELLATLAEETRDRTRWCFIGRDLSALPVASWLAYDIAELPLDAEDLRFSTGECAELNRLRRSPLAAEALTRLSRRTHGWPLATSWALDVVLDEAALASLPGEPDALVAFLTATTLAALSPGERDVLAATCVLPDLDPRVLGALPGTRIAATLARLLADVPALFLRETPLRYQPEIRAQIRASSMVDEAIRNRYLRDAASALERADRSEAALRLLTAMTDAEAIAGVLAREGLALAERGSWAYIDPALHALEGSPFGDEPALLALRAASESNREHFDTAEAWFRMAIERSTGAPDASRIAHRFALEAMRRGRPDLVESIASHVLAHNEDGSAPALAMRATLATALAALEDHARAADEIGGVLERLHPGVPPKDRARILQQAAFVAVRAEAFEQARDLATRAFAAAVAAGAYNVAALAKTLLYEVAIEADDDPHGALFHLEEFARYALLSGGERLHLFALLATFSVHVERGDVTGIERVERVLRGRELMQHTAFINETLLADEAMRAAWAGDFERALRMVSGTVEQETGARRFLRLAEVSVYAAAAGRAAESRDAIERITRWEELPLATRNGRTPALIALAHVLLGEGDAARRIILRARERGALKRVRNAALFAAIEVAIGYGEGRSGADDVTRSLIELEQQSFGGYARLIAALPSAAFLPGL